jgi:hypothetical protein
MNNAKQEADARREDVLSAMLAIEYARQNKTCEDYTQFQLANAARVLTVPDTTGKFFVNIKPNKCGS